jgi:surface antigen
LLPSGINPSLGCNPLRGCTAKDYYLPGKGVWAPQQKFGMKATIGAVGGSALGAYAGAQTGDPLTTAVASVIGLVLGHEIGATFDKIDQLHGAMLMQRVLDHGRDGEIGYWKNPNKPVAIATKAVSTNGDCREFVTKVTVKGEARQVRGTACKRNGEWEVKEMY